MSVLSKERLTYRTYNPCDECNYSFSKQNQESGTCKLCEFKNYINFEEQGLLLRLPVAVGGSIWDNDFGSPYRYEVTGFSYGDINEDDYDYDEELQTDELIVHYRNHSGSITGKFLISEIGKTVFLTQSEAEEKLRELEGKYDG